MLHELFTQLVNYGILFFEYTGVLILMVSGVRALIRYVKGDPAAQMNLARGMTVALEFKLGSEILRTVIVRDMREIFLVAGIIALRSALTFLIWWEIRAEKKESERLAQEAAGEGGTK